MRPDIPAIDGQTLVDQARTWLGTPFRHQGRIKGQGVDCGGLLLGVGRELGLPIDDPPAYSHSPDPDIFAVMFAAWCVPVPRSALRPGDLLHFSFAGEPRHVGIATDIGVIHAWAKPGKVVEHRMDVVWQKRLRGVWRAGL